MDSSGSSSLSSSPCPKRISHYVSFQNGNDDEDDDHSQSEFAQPITPMIPVNGNPKTKGNCSNSSNCTGITLEGDSFWDEDGDFSRMLFQSRRIGLLPAETERENLLRSMNDDIFRWLVAVQVISSLLIVISQIILYVIPSELYNYLNHIGIGIWGPFLVFAPTCLLSYLAIRSPSGCCIGSALACQITSLVVGLLLVIVGLIGLSKRGRWVIYINRRNMDGEEYDPEVAARIFESLMLIGAICLTVASFISSIQYCRIGCGGRAVADESLLYQVDVVKV